MKQFRHISSNNTNFGFGDENDGFDPKIKDCHCQCKTGARTVGCCTQIASDLWYVEYYRYMENISQYHSDAYPEYEMDAIFLFKTDDSED